jgi:hypothetical protein
LINYKSNGNFNNHIIPNFWNDSKKKKKRKEFIALFVRYAQLDSLDSIISNNKPWKSGNEIEVYGDGSR